MKKFERLFAIYKVLHYNTITSPQAPVSGVAKFGTISHFKHGSGYTKTLVEQLLRGFFYFTTLKLVTFGHHFEKWGPKKRQKGAEKNV
ncbi:MAG: hypothetical protein IKC30_00005, partial [Rikenellaceae bacterium]|nr:hypothetical protein [Rikenellaceae bacterium]